MWLEFDCCWLYNLLADWLLISYCFFSWIATIWTLACIMKIYLWSWEGKQKCNNKWLGLLKIKKKTDKGISRYIQFWCQNRFTLPSFNYFVKLQYICIYSVKRSVNVCGKEEIKKGRKGKREEGRKMYGREKG